LQWPHRQQISQHNTGADNIYNNSFYVFLLYLFLTILHLQSQFLISAWEKVAENRLQNSRHPYFEHFKTDAPFSRVTEHLLIRAPFGLVFISGSTTGEWMQRQATRVSPLPATL